MNLYLYGIIDSGNQIKEAIYGLEGAGVYSIPFRDIGAVVSEIGQPIQEATEGTILEHEAVVEKLMADFTVLPVRFQTVIDGRDNLLSIMQSFYKDFKDNLKKLHNKLEFGIKVIWHADKIKENIINALKKDGQKKLDPGGSPGKRYMKKKFEKYKVDKEFDAKADKFIKVMDIFLNRFAAEKKLEKLKSKDLLLDAVYLVERSQESNFREAFEHIKSARPDFKYLFSGPWPAYNFVVLSKQSGLPGYFNRANPFDKVADSQILVGAGSV
jgi:hypothetical protein